MLQYERIDISEGISIDRSNKSKECMICHHWYFKDIGYKFEPLACNISMMAYKLENIVILSIKGVNYRYVLWNITRNDAINRLNISELDDKGQYGL